MMAGKKSNTTLPKRASEREGFKLDVRAKELRDLMTEQSRQPWGWSTFYSGTSTELARAGIPEHLFTRGKKRVMFRANSQDGYIQVKGQQYELELQWDNNGPWYASAVHPALGELARMVLLDIGWWMDGRIEGLGESDEIPVQKLIDCTAAVDYRLPPTKRFKFGPGCRDRIRTLTMRLHHYIQNAEILAIEAPAVQTSAPSDGKVINMKQARAKLNQRAELTKGERPL